MNCSTPGLPVHHQLLESTQTHVHQVGDAIQPSYHLSSPSPPGLNLSQHQGLFQWVSSSHHVAKVLEFQLQHQAFLCCEYSELISFKIDWFDLLVFQGAPKSLLQHPSSKASTLRLSAVFLLPFYCLVLFHCMCSPLCINSPVDWHLGCFQFGAYKCSFWEHSWPRLYVDMLSFLLDKYLGEEWQVQWQVYI